MDIKKSDLIGYIRNISKQNIEKDLKKGNNNQQANGMLKTGQPISLDRLRGQVLGIQEELRTMQTTISFNQGQLAHLEQTSSENWQHELRRFMSENFQSASNDMQNRFEKRLEYLDAKEEYVGAIKDEMRKLSSDLMVKEVQLQNIVSSGLVDDSEIKASNEIVKDIVQSNDLFSKLRGDKIKNLLES